MKNFTIMIKPASSLCDMRCRYCFYYDVAASRHMASMGIMTQDTAAALIRNVYSGLEAGDSVTFAFQGGEPGLAGLPFFEFFAETVKKVALRGVRTSYAFQTNGLMINDAWCRFFVKNNFLVGLSLDGDAALHNQNRIDAQGKATYNRVMDAKRLMDKHKAEYNILCVLTAESARRARRIWNFILKEGIRHIQFIPCLEPLEIPENSVHHANNEHMANEESATSSKNTSQISIEAALTGKRFGLFYSGLFPLWKAEVEKGNLVHVRLFEDLAGIYLAGQRLTCGMSGRCTPQMVVEADGSVYPCDFYVLDEYRVANLAESTIKEVFNAVVNCGFLDKQPTKYAVCNNCSYSKWCQGGCKRMSKAVYGHDCGMKSFLDKHLHDLLAVAQRLVGR